MENDPAGQAEALSLNPYTWSLLEINIWLEIDNWHEINIWLEINSWLDFNNWLEINNQLEVDNWFEIDNQLDIDNQLGSTIFQLVSFAEGVSLYYSGLNFHNYHRIGDLITGLKEDGIEPRKLLGHLEYVQEAIQYLLNEHDKSRNSLDIMWVKSFKNMILSAIFSVNKMMMIFLSLRTHPKMWKNGWQRHLPTVIR